ncbi:MAG: phosphoribosylformylglycinamidine synthase subunit PurL [Actinomycetes bacterium]
MSIDTVKNADSTPDLKQPYTELGLKADEYAKIHEHLGRRPTSSELAMYSVMWSEHCSYKSSKVHLRQFGDKLPAEAKDILLVGMGENAGVVDVGNGLAVTFKIESHNHPSYVEPYQGAATGIGGIVRDILSMGARPVAVMDPLRFGPADAPDTHRVLPGVIAGIGGYGNCLGLPNIGGEVVFDETYLGNPLVNALCVGVVPHDRIQVSAATGSGNHVILFGAKTGGDGIGGVSVLASETFDDAGTSKRPSVQVGDPFAEKVLIEACQQLFEQNLVVGIQDLGGAGISCATSEMASNGDTGMHVWLDRVPLRDSTLAPEEILMSESQERMMAVVSPAQLDGFMAVCRKWDVEAVVIGEVNDSSRLTIEWHGDQIVDVPPKTVAHEGPVYERPFARPSWQDALQADRPNNLGRPASGNQLKQALLQLVSSPNLASKSWVTDQYDRYVLGNTVLAQPEDSGVIRIADDGMGVALSTDGNGRYGKLDPYAGAQLALGEAYRNVATTGAKPLAVTNCLNFGSPEDPDVMWQFAETARGLADACQQLGVPVTGGNVSFYNQTGDTAILPTVIVGVLGVIDDVARRTPMAWSADGDAIWLVGETRDEFGGSEWAHVVHGHLGGTPPAIDLKRERQIAEIAVAASRDGLLTAAHDVSVGGLAITLVEMALRSGKGARVFLPEAVDSFTGLFSESAGRIVFVVPRSEEVRFTDMCTARGVPASRIGVVDSEVGGIEIQGQFTASLDELRHASESTFPRLFD